MSNELLLLLATLSIVFYIWQRRVFAFWKRHGVNYIRPVPLLGCTREFLTARVPFFEQIRKFHEAPGFENAPFVGVFMAYRPALVIRDLDLVKTVMIKKFQYFNNRVLQTDPHNDALGFNNLFFARSPEWRELRTKISPAFTTGKIKQMYPLMVKIGKNLEDSAERLGSGSNVQVKDLCARFTTDLIATIAFGLEANALQNAKSEFFYHNKAIFAVTLGRAIDFAIIFMLPALATLARVKLFSKETTKFIRTSINYVLTERERTGQKRNDLVDILLAFKREAAANPEKSQKALDLDYLVAQAAIFQTAGYETSSSTMTLALYELARREDLQERLRQEISDFFGDEDHVSYERIQEMPYLSQVVNETLRKYPIVGYVERECSQPAEGERFTLEPFHNMELPHGTSIYMSTLAIHRDPKYWPEPKEFDPERFNPANRDKLNMDAYMPFGVGPRNCIGMRLGLLQSKLGLVHLLRNHRVHTCDQTVKEIEWAATSPVLASKNEIVLRLEKV
ncbi:probable cytochrome P450 6w1 isoform X1 [Drosophila takahashii]|uniref:probable cytochrome P450 6w1 isoform X1 n=2 Tax=Drosophila takahashii TaxID=29030 RepID=UPI001CF8C242|nr:probable cytochrome P450 6w1 [Drosophila takahashii]